MTARGANSVKAKAEIFCYSCSGIGISFKCTRIFIVWLHPQSMAWMMNTKVRFI